MNESISELSQFRTSTVLASIYAAAYRIQLSTNLFGTKNCSLSLFDLHQESSEVPYEQSFCRDQYLS